jgi:hypothetical protein
MNQQDLYQRIHSEQGIAPAIEEFLARIHAQCPITYELLQRDPDSTTRAIRIQPVEQEPGQVDLQRLIFRYESHWLAFAPKGQELVKFEYDPSHMRVAPGGLRDAFQAAAPVCGRRLLEALVVALEASGGYFTGGSWSPDEAPREGARLVGKFMLHNARERYWQLPISFFLEIARTRRKS